MGSSSIAFHLLTVNVSILDLRSHLEKAAQYDGIKKVVKQASKKLLKVILSYTDDQVVSCNFNNDSHSSTFNAAAGIAIDDNFIKLIFLYENEYVYNNRVVYLMGYMAFKQ